MTRGGVRKGAGRPKAEAETRTANLCGVRITPSQLASYKKAAAFSSTSLSQWVTGRLDEAEAHLAPHIRRFEALYGKIADRSE